MLQKHERMRMKRDIDLSIWLNIQPKKITESNSDTILAQENPRKPIYG